MDLSKFQLARLIPVTGIKGAQDQERRATSALLAVMRLVPDLAWSLLKDAKPQKGSIEAFIEPEFKNGKKAIRPDGLLVTTRGKKTWSALIEVKTGKNELDKDQLTAYLDLCRDNSIDCLITISNQVLNASGEHPTPGIDQRKLKSTKLVHLSWLRVITDCLILSEHKGVEDTEQDQVLSELIRFLQSSASGASEFNDMGASWTEVRDGIKSDTITRPTEELNEIVARYESLTRYAALTLSARLGVTAKESVPRLAQTDYKKHLTQSSQSTIKTKELVGAIVIPDAAAPLSMRADISSGILHCEFDLDAPQDRKNRPRITWILSQLRKAPDETRVRWSYKRARVSESPHSLGDLRDKTYEYDLDNDREIQSFKIELVSKMGTKRSSGKGSFIDSVVDLYEKTYGEVLQPIKPWVKPAPKFSESVKDILPETDSKEV